MFKIGDNVLITFSDGHKQQGIITQILTIENFNYVVQTKVFGKDTEVYCNSSSLELNL